MASQNTDVYMILDVDSSAQTFTLYNAVLDRTIKHPAKDQDELDTYEHVFHDCSQINIFLLVEYNEQTREILRT